MGIWIWQALSNCLCVAQGVNLVSFMGGTSFDIGLVVKGGVKFYDFNPVIDRWLVNIPMVHLVTLGAGGGSIARYDRLRRAVAVGPESAGSDPGPACYNRGGREPTVSDADLALGYLLADRYANGTIPLDERRAERAIEKELATPLGIDMISAAKLVRQKIDNDMPMALRRNSVYAATNHVISPFCLWRQRSAACLRHRVRAGR